MAAARCRRGGGGVRKGRRRPPRDQRRVSCIAVRREIPSPRPKWGGNPSARTAAVARGCVRRQAEPRTGALEEGRGRSGEEESRGRGGRGQDVKVKRCGRAAIGRWLWIPLCSGRLTTLQLQWLLPVGLWTANLQTIFFSLYSRSLFIYFSYLINNTVYFVLR